MGISLSKKGSHIACLHILNILLQPFRHAHVLVVFQLFLLPSYYGVDDIHQINEIKYSFMHLTSYTQQAIKK